MRAATRCWLVFLFWLLALPAFAQTPMSPRAFSSHDEGVILNHDFTLLRDASGDMDIDAVAASNRFRHAQWHDFTPGYTKDVIWLRFSFYNPMPDDGDRYLEISPPRLQDIRLYERLPNGSWQVHQGGTVVPVDQRLVPARVTAFPLRLLPGERREVYVRISSGNAIMLHARLWQPQEFHQAERQLDLLNGLQYGAIILLTVYGLALFFMTREPALIFFVLMVGMAGINDISLLQYAYQYLWADSPDWNLRSPGITGVISMVGGAWLVLRLLKGRQHFPRLTQVLHVFCLLMLLTLPALLWLDYSVWAQASYALSLVVILLIAVLAVCSVRAGVPDAWLVLQAFALTWVLTVLRLGQLFGYLPHDILIDYSQNWAMLLSGSLIVIAIMATLRKLREEREAAELRAAQARLQAEQDVHLHTQELRLAKEMAEANSHAKSAFLAQLSHELRTPLHSILGYSGLILSESGSLGDRRRASAVLQSGRHLLALIDELLDYARLEANKLTLEPRPVYLHSLLKAAIQEVQQLGQVHGITLDMELAPGLPSTFMLDPVRLRQVLLNLMVNACRHSQASRITLQAGVEAGRLLLAVRDNGVGIPPQERARLFRPFEQGRAHREGMGLGLAISQQFVQLMGGSLVCDEAEGGGSHFHFSIPLEEAPEAQVELLAGELMPRHYKGPVQRVLVVDDIAENRALLADVLATIGFDVALAEGGHAALQELSGSRFDLVITDQLMPGMSGWEFLRHAREQSHAMPFILLSGAAPVLPDNWPPSLVFAVILMKPAEPALLAEAIASALRLEWEEADAVLAAEAMQRPPEAELLLLRQAASEGRVSDIEDWVARWQAVPECRPFALAVQEAVRRLDLPGILMLAAATA